MPNLKEIFNGDSSNEIINRLRRKSVKVEPWDKLRSLYEPSEHEIVNDKTTRKDKVRSDGTVEKAARIPVGLEKLLVGRYNDFTFSIPVKRVYSNIDDNKTRQEIANAIEAVYKHARIDAVNLNRGRAYYASCEIFTIWYTVKRENDLYGFHSLYKLKCKTYSPMDGVRLYPLIDEMDDMIAMSFEYEKNVDGKDVTFFETFTADTHYLWKRSTSSSEGWEEVLKSVDSEGEEVSGESISILKIPGAYTHRKEPVYKDLSDLRQEIEYTLSRDSDVIAYNSAPVLKVVGELQGEEDKNESRRLYRVANGGDIDYVSWSQSNEAVTYHVDTMLKLFFMLSQMPDVSFDNLKALGNIGYDARQTLLTDTYLKIGEEAGSWVEFFERECNVIKAFLKQMNLKWKNEVDQVDVEHIITPFIQNDEKYNIEKWMKANGDKPLVGHLESIRNAGLADDADATLDELREEASQSLTNKVADLFGGSSAE